MSEPFKSGLSFQTRITIAAMATAVGVLMVACALFTAEQWSAEQAGLKQHERFVAGALTDKLAAAADAGSVNATMQGLALSPRIVSAKLMDSQGRVVCAYNRARDKGAAADGVVESQTPVIRDGRRVGTLTLKAGSERMGSFLAGFCPSGSSSQSADFLSSWRRSRTAATLGGASPGSRTTSSAG
jgi:hypothetical protein